MGIGANTAIFSIINAALLRSLCLTESEWLIMIWQTHTNVTRTWRAFHDFVDAPFKNAVQIHSGN
jgi:hypothetical protein